jgi:adenosylcobinamide-GDP ribazoletransferase
MSAAAGRPGRATILQALALATLLSTIVLAPSSFLFGLVLAPLAGIAGMLAMVGLSRSQIGGQTGDVAGASQVVSETFILIAAVLVLTA